MSRKRDAEKQPFEIETRPWGWMAIFCKNKRATVKVLHVKKGEALSLQRHRRRTQVYFIIDPIRVWNGTEQINAVPGQWFVFKPGVLHRAENIGTENVARYLEVSFGSYNENDIERVLDYYGRAAKNG